MTEDSVSVVSVRWGIGIAVTLMVFLGSSLWAASSTAAERASELKVLEARVNNLENTVSHISSSITQISTIAGEMKATQAAFQATLHSEITHLKEEIRDMENRR